MEARSNEPRSLIVSARLYQALLRIYPSQFRRDYGGPMLQVFRDCCRQAFQETGTPGLLIVWMRTILDAAQSALEEHMERGVDMSKEKFIKMSGWGLMLAGVVLTLGFLAGTRPEYNQYNARSLPVDRYANAATGPLMILSTFLLLVGLIGLFLHDGSRAGGFGRASLALGILSAAVGTIGSIGLAAFDSELWWSIFFISFMFIFVGLALFGFANLSAEIKLGGRLFPLLAGVWIPTYLTVSLILEQARGQWVNLPMGIDLFVFLITAAGLIGLGYGLRSEPQTTGVNAAAVS